MGKIVRISGPVVIAEDIEGVRMFDVVKVGNSGLVGEAIYLPTGMESPEILITGGWQGSAGYTWICWI